MSNNPLPPPLPPLEVAAKRQIYLIAALIAVVLLWAYLARLDEVVVGQGTVVPSQATAEIASLEGGILSELLVRTGQVVSEGQDVAIISDVNFRSAYQESLSQSESLAARKARLHAQLASVLVDATADDPLSQVIIKPQQIEDDALTDELILGAQQAYDAAMAQLTSELLSAAQGIEQHQQALAEAKATSAMLGQSLGLTSKELKMTEDIYASGAVAEIEVLKLRRDQVRLSGELTASRRNENKLQASVAQSMSEYRKLAHAFLYQSQSELEKVSAELSRLDQGQEALADRVARTRLTSPVSGMVKTVHSRTIGGVIKPGDLIMEIVPQDDNLLIEARIAPQDIGFVQIGMPALVKFTAFDFTIYGGIQGQVAYLSPDVLLDEEGNSYYQAHVLTQSNQLAGNKVIPGMQASVDVITGNKNVLAYWLKPLLRGVNSAMREP